MSAPPRAPRALTAGVVGPGRVGAALGAALVAAGHRVVAVTPSSQPQRVRSLLPAAQEGTLADVVHAGTDLLLVTVPDDALATVAAHVAGAGPAPGCVVVHTSGAHGLATLAPVAEAGAHPLALHPAMTFTGAVDGDTADPRRVPGTAYGVTAPDHLREFAAQLVDDLGGHVEWIAEDARPLYHAALAHGANHLATLVNDATDQLRAAGVRRPDAMLAPLLRAALDNTLHRGDDALTGPVVRRDAGTVDRHLRALSASTPEVAEAYRALARRTTDRAAAAGQIPDDTAAALHTVLDAGPATGPVAGRDTGPEAGRETVPAADAVGSAS